MMRSLFAGVSALRNHQTRMDVIGNNIANVNTVGFKSSQVNFQDLYSQTVREATAPRADRGGTNPIQVGLGVGLSAVTTNFTPGNLQPTGLVTDLAIDGDGFFVLGRGAERYYTRAGMFIDDRDGNLVASGTGYHVMGWQADVNGNIDTNAALSAIRIPKDETINASATNTITFSGNLDARETGALSYLAPGTITVGGTDVQLEYRLTPTGNFNEWKWEIHVQSPAGLNVVNGQGTVTLDHQGNVTHQSSALDAEIDLGSGDRILIRPPQIGDPAGGNFAISTDNGATFTDGDTSWSPAEVRQTSIRVYDSLGNEREVFMSIRKTGDNTWAYEAQDEAGNDIGNGTLHFDANGRLLSQTGTISLPGVGGALPTVITPDFTRATQFAENPTLAAVSQDGFASGTLTGLSIDANGVVTGMFSNGLTRAIAQIAMATFSNTSGLKKVGNSMYQTTVNSGDPQIGAAGSGRVGGLVSGSLEMSNVDLAQEFTNMIVTQRGFQANSRIITTSDEMLQELVNLKR